METAEYSLGAYHGLPMSARRLPSTSTQTYSNVTLLSAR